MSGGVDSSMAAVLLREAGYRVIGAVHDLHPYSELTDPEHIVEIEKLCKRLGIEFLRLPMADIFLHQVIDDFAASYRDGVTPNPCVRCNERLRFGRFIEELKRRLPPFFFSTGHYVRIGSFRGRTCLRRGVDAKKDQSYMLYRIRPELLDRLIFPLGELAKEEVVRRAKEMDLPTAGVRESQDACFVEKDYTDILRERLSAAGGGPVDSAGSRIPGLEPGVIRDENGAELGRHRGYLHYTVGQRKGLDLSNGPWYVSALDARTNTVYVARNPGVDEFEVGELNWFLSGAEGEAVIPAAGMTTEVQIRYQSRPRICALSPAGNQTLRVRLEEPAGVTPGQSAVFYSGEYLIGGGIIKPPAGA
ncbi:MAG: tRNA 2-thiouridine(34) synthase MnmA [Spirochaetales bacterium]|nr:tRNA 2-thiouridine(34) synthase MnmA [Spirochaetales bacterium]MCF7938108.1 tRNA 2-thiouridine(34) synthase MnmA [Spirochaetales bacterium]